MVPCIFKSRSMKNKQTSNSNSRVSSLYSLTNFEMWCKHMDSQQRWRYIGRTLRILIFGCNSIAWIIAMMCLAGGLLVGFYSKSLMFGMGLIDFWLSTPVTVFIYYGTLIGIASGAGCFAGSGGRWWWTAIYCILLVLLAIFDGVCGINIFFSPTSLTDFLGAMNSSLNDYETNKTFGIFPYPVRVYWDHLQQQGHCCGFSSWEQWKDTSLGSRHNLPDSCCNERYAYPSCGEYLLRHPDKTTHFKKTQHLMRDIIHTKACITGYPRLWIAFFDEASIIGVSLAAILIFCCLASLVLFIIVAIKKYRPGKNKEQDDKGRHGDPENPPVEDTGHPRDFPSQRLKNVNPHPDEKGRSGIFRSKPVDGPVRLKNSFYDKPRPAPARYGSEAEAGSRVAVGERISGPRNTGEQKIIRTENPPPYQSRFQRSSTAPPNTPKPRHSTANASRPYKVSYAIRSNKVHPEPP